MNLPPQFTAQMQTLLQSEYPAYLASFTHPRLHGLRVNTRKLAPEKFKSIAPFPIRPIPWIPNGFYYEESARPSKDPYYYAGLYYLQEPSAMTPASLLPITPGDMVLDLCAAPGGKSTELGAKLNGKGLLFTNDISNTRAKSLLKNLELAGIPNLCVTSESPDRLSEAFPQFFDKILVDAPCSGEGMFRKDPAMITSWLERGPDGYAPLQKEILLHAADMLKPGGILLYSTCTFSVKEDEEVVRYLLESRDDMHLLPIPLWEGASSGIGMDGCVRLFPHKIEGEGHFIAMLEKSAGETRNLPPKDYRPVNLNKEPELAGFIAQTSYPFQPDRLVSKQGLVYYLPEGYREGVRLRYLRTGLLVGEIKKNRFEPSQALAMALKPDQFPAVLSLDHDDPRVIRYLKGETLVLTEHEPELNGWCLVCVEGYPLGFAKGSRHTLKNKYYPGWRWQ